MKSGFSRGRRIAALTVTALSILPPYGFAQQQLPPAPSPDGAAPPAGQPDAPAPLAPGPADPGPLPTPETQIATRTGTILSHIRSIFSSDAVVSLAESTRQLDEAATSGNLEAARIEVDQIVADLRALGDRIRPDSAVERAILSLDTYIVSVAETIKQRPNLTPDFVSSRTAILEQFSARLATHKATISGFFTALEALLAQAETLRESIALDMIIGRIERAAVDLETSTGELAEFLASLETYVQSIEMPARLSVEAQLGE
jgi:hypothetical protein